MSSCLNKVYSVFGFKMRLCWRETHHGYYGMALMLYGLYLLIWGGSVATIAGGIVFLFGAYLFWDDFILQHHRQVTEFNPCYHSPVHNWYVNNLYGFGIIKLLNKIIDKFFALSPYEKVAIIILIITLWIGGYFL